MTPNIFIPFPGLNIRNNFPFFASVRKKLFHSRLFGYTALLKICQIVPKKFLQKSCHINCFVNILIKVICYNFHFKLRRFTFPSSALLFYQCCAYRHMQLCTYAQKFAWQNHHPCFFFHMQGAKKSRCPCPQVISPCAHPCGAA